METDASVFAIASVLTQRHEGIHLLVVFFSPKLNTAEMNYEVYDMEMLARVESFGEWPYYLEGAKFPTMVFSDHKNLEFFATTKKVNRWQSRWAQKLSTFDFQMKFPKGTQNEKADPLSRWPEYRPREGGSDLESQLIRWFFKPERLICGPDQDMVEREEQENLVIVMV